MTNIVQFGACSTVTEVTTGSLHHCVNENTDALPDFMIPPCSVYTFRRNQAACALIALAAYGGLEMDAG